MVYKRVILILLVNYAASEIISDCSSINTKEIPACTGSVLIGQGLCGENVCARVSKTTFRCYLTF